MLQDYIIFAQCSGSKSTIFLKEVVHNNVIFKCSPEISELQSKLVFDKAANYFIGNPNQKFHICKYMNVYGNFLFNFDRRSPYDHYNIWLGVFNGFNVNLQLTHHKLNDFLILSDENLEKKTKFQYVSEKIYIYNNYVKFFLNSDGLYMNECLKSFENYELFLPDLDKAIKIQNYLEKYENNLNNYYCNAFFPKITK